MGVRRDADDDGQMRDKDTYACLIKSFISAL